MIDKFSISVLSAMWGGDGGSSSGMKWVGDECNRKSNSIHMMGVFHETS